MDKPAGSGPVFRGSNPLRGTIFNHQFQMSKYQIIREF